MTDRFKGFVVTLEANIREDDAERVINALKMVKGVIAVEPVKSDAIGDVMAEHRVREDLRKKMIAVLWPSMLEGGA